MKSIWVFKMKVNPDGTFDKFKARACALGDSQVYGIDYNKVYAPTLPMAALRLFLAVAAELYLDIHSMDVVGAFLNAEIDTEASMEQLHGFKDKNHPDWVCRLIRALYGLKQAPLLWYKDLSATLQRLGYVPVPSCPCRFVRSHSSAPPSLGGLLTCNNDLIIILVYVDDLLLGARTGAALNAAKAELAGLYKFTDNV